MPDTLDTATSTGAQNASSSKQFDVAEPTYSATASSETAIDGKTPGLVSYAAQEDLDEDGLKKVVRKSGITTVIVSGIALFSDGYIVQIGLTTCMVGYMELIFTSLYHIDEYTKARLSNSFLVGEIFGMLTFGAMIDRLGRRTGVVWATIFLVLGVVLATASSGSTPTRLFWMMTIARGIAGFGAGGEYPTCATSAVEASDETQRVQRVRGKIIAVSTIFAIDLGNVVSGIVAIIVLLCYNKEAHDGIWRICFGIGMILPIAVFIFRFRMINSTQYRRHAIKRNVPYLQALRWHWKPALGAILTWFFYDFIRYPFGLFSATIISGFNPNGSLLESIGYGTLVNTFYLPGTLLGGYLADRIGRRQTMTLGFACLAVLGFVIGGSLRQLKSVFPLFVVLYGIFNAFGEMGPGSTVFLAASEPFPTPLRGHFLGLAAAMGKVGAVVGTQVFNPIIDSFSTVEKGQQAAFLIGSAFAVVGAICAWTLVPDTDIALETGSAKFEHMLQESGYTNDEIGESMNSNIKFSVYEPGELHK